MWNQTDYDMSYRMSRERILSYLDSRRSSGDRKKMNSLIRIMICLIQAWI